MNIAEVKAIRSELVVLEEAIEKVNSLEPFGSPYTPEHTANISRANYLYAKLEE